jgi:hypothetical protein
LAYRARLSSQFLWASQQAAEKYLKCILFIRRIPAKNLKHDLAPALQLIEKSAIPLELMDRSRQLVGRIDAMGRFRYMEISQWVEWHWIVALDQLIWELRRFCTLDPAATAVRLAYGKRAPRVRLIGGRLERILDNRDDPAREALLWQNAYFGRGRRTIAIRGGLSAVNSPLFGNADLLDEILQYAYVPKEVVKAYREQASRE